MKSNIKFSLLAFGIIIAISFRPVPKQEQQPQQPKTYILRLSQTDLQSVLGALGKQPFQEVANTYLSISSQVQQQDNQPPVTEKPKADSTKPKKQ